MKTYKKKKFNAKSTGGAAIKWEYWSLMEDLNIENHVINPPAAIIITPAPLPAPAAARSVINLICNYVLITNFLVAP